MASSSSFFLAAGILLCASSCGPTAITLGIASRGGGGGFNPPPPIAIAGTITLDPTQTELSWRFVQPQARPVRFWLEFDSACHGSGRIPAEHLRFADPVPTATGGNEFVGPASADPGVLYKASWNHGAHFGRAEARLVDVVLRFRDDQRGDDAVDAKDLLKDRKVGSAPPQLSAPSLERADSANAESALVGTFRFEDFGDDPPTRWDVQYAVQSGGAWIDLRDVVVNQVREPGFDCPVTYTCSFAIDPLAHAMPFGTYASLSLQVRVVEGDDASNWLPFEIATAIGKLPLITSVVIPDPGNNVTISDEPRFLLPLVVTLVATSSRPQTLEFDGQYDINNGSLRPRTAMVFARTDRTETSRTIQVLPGQTRVHYLIWSVVGNEGLGIIRMPDQIAHVHIRARVVEPRAPVELRTAWNPSNATTLLTPPFIAYREQLSDSAQRFVSASVGKTNRTRDIFYTKRAFRRGTTQRQDYVMGVDQTFSPVRIIGLAEYDIQDYRYRLGGSPQNGFLSLYPVDFVADQPECIGRIADNRAPFFYLKWPASAVGNGGLPTVVAIPDEVTYLGGQRTVGGRAEFALSLVGGPATGYLFLGRDDYPTNPPPPQTPEDSTIYLVPIVRTALGEWRANNGEFTRRMPEDPFRSSRLPGLAPQFMVADLDGDPRTQEVLVANQGIERATSDRTGWFDVFQMEPDETGLVQFRTLARPPLPQRLPGADRNISTWWLQEWPTADPSKPSVLLVREFEAVGRDERVVTFDLLERGPSGGVLDGQWRRLTQLEETRHEFASKSLMDVFALDLDGDLDGASKAAEVVALFKRPRTGVGTSATLDGWIYTTTPREPYPRDARWRRFLTNLGPARASALGSDFDGGAVITDVNGDEFPDLVLREVMITGTPPSADVDTRAHYLFASALTGAISGFNELSLTNNPASQQPAVGDFDLDNRADILSAGNLYRGTLTGYELHTGGFGGRATESFLRQQVFDVGEAQRADGTPTHPDVIVFDRTATTTNFGWVQRMKLEGEGAGRRVVPLERTPIQSMAAIQGMTAFVPPGRSGVGSIKDLAGAVGTTVLRLHRFEHSLSGFVGREWNVVGDPIVRDVVALRIDGLLPGQDSARIARTQSIVVGMAGTSQVVLVNANRGYGREEPVVVGGAGEQILRLAAASVTADPLEDVLVATVETPTTGPAIIRLHCLEQVAGGLLRLVDRAFLQFEDGAGSGLRGIGFDRDAMSYAHGLLVMGNGVRFVLPSTDQRGPRCAMIRSTLPLPLTEDEVGLQVTDYDHDGQVEVLGGVNFSGQPASRLIRVNRAYRSPGN